MLAASLSDVEARRTAYEVALAKVTDDFIGRLATELEISKSGVFAHFGSLLTELLRFSGLPPAKIRSPIPTRRRTPSSRFPVW